MKNQINNEIQRIQKIMGVEILTEQPAVRGVVKDTRKFLEKILEKLNWKPSNLEPFIENPEVKTVLTKNLNKLTPIESQQILKSLNPSIVNHLFENGLVPIKIKQKAFGNLTQAVVDGRISFETAIKELRQAGYLKKLYNKSLSMPEDLDVPRHIETLSNSVDEKLANEFAEYYKRIKPAGNADTLRMMEPTGLKAWRQVFLKYWYTKNKKLIDLIETQADKVALLANKKTPDGFFLDEEKIHHEVKKLTNMVVSLRTTAKKGLNANLKKYISENPNIPKEVREELLEENYFKILLNTVNEDTSKLLKRILLQKLNAYLEMFQIFNVKNLEKLLGGLERILLTITFKSPVLLSEIVTNAIRNGRTASRVERGAVWLVIHNAIVPYSLALWETFSHNKKLKKYKETLTIMKQFCDAGLVKKDCPTQEEIDKIISQKPEDVLNNFYKANPILKMVVGSDGRRVLDFLFFTWWDEIIQYSLDWYKKNTFTFDETSYEQFKSKVSEFQDKLQQEAKRKGYIVSDKGWEQALYDEMLKEKQSQSANDKPKSDSTINKPPTDSTTKYKPATNLDSLNSWQ